MVGGCGSWLRGDIKIIEIMINFAYNWLNTLVWARADMSNPPLGISWFELICNFLVTAQYPIPVNIAWKNSDYVTPDQTAHDLTQYDLGHTIMSFQRAISHLEFLSQTQLVPNNNGVKTGSLYCLGSGTMRLGFRSRPKMLRQQETMRYVWQYLSDHSKDGKVSFTVLPNVPVQPTLFHMRFEVPAEDNHRTRLARYFTLREQIKQLQQPWSLRFCSHLHSAILLRFLIICKLRYHDWSRLLCFTQKTLVMPSQLQGCGRPHTQNSLNKW